MRAGIGVPLSFAGYYFATSLLSREWIFEFCEALRKKKYNLKWGCQSRVDSVTRELLKAMKAAGCVQIDYGVESGSEKVLKKLKKGITPKKVEEAFAMTKEIGLRAMASFMIGNPGEEKEDIDKTFELAKKISPDYVQFFYTTPYPGAELYEMAKENKWLIGDLDFTDQWEHHKIDNPQSFDPVMEINFSKEELRAIRTRLQNHFLINNYKLHLTNYKFLFALLTTMVKNPGKSIKWIKHILLTRGVDEVSSQILNEYRRAYYDKRIRNKG